MKLTGTIYTTNRLEFIEDCLPEIISHVSKSKSLQMGDLIIEEIELDKNTPLVPKTRNGVSYTDLDWDWVKKNYPADGNLSCLHISRKERNQLGLLHSSGRDTLGGRYNRNMGDASMEFLVIADTVKTFIRLFLHELSHGFSHWTGVTDLTHAFEDSGKYIGDIYVTYNFASWNALKYKVDHLTEKRDDLLVKKKTK